MWYSVKVRDVVVGSALLGCGGGIAEAASTTEKHDDVMGIMARCAVGGMTGGAVVGFLGVPTFYLMPVILPTALAAKAYAYFT